MRASSGQGSREHLSSTVCIVLFSSRASWEAVSRSVRASQVPLLFPPFVSSAAALLPGVRRNKGKESKCFVSLANSGQTRREETLIVII